MIVTVLKIGLDGNDGSKDNNDHQTMMRLDVLESSFLFEFIQFIFFHLMMIKLFCVSFSLLLMRIVLNHKNTSMTIRGGSSLVLLTPLHLF